MAETTIDKVNVEIESNSSKASSGIDSLVASIQKLKGVNSEGVSSLNSLNNSIKQIAGNLSSLNKADSGVNKVTSSLKKIKNHATTLDKSRIKLNLFDNTGTISSIYSGMSAFDKFKSKSMDFASNTTKKISKGMNTAFNNIKEHWSKGDLSKWLKVGAFLGVMSKISKAIAGFIQNSSDYISNINYFNTSMAEMKDTATEFINTMSTKFYLDPSSMMKYMASFNTLIKGFGIGSEAAYTMSKNLTQLTYDYSALTGISMEDMMQKLKSGISGELEPMRAIGVALDQATLQEVAYSLGIEKKISTMTRAQKTELAYYQIMKSTAYAQNLFAKSLATTRSELNGTTKTILLPSTALSILKQQFSQLGRAIGNIFIPILTKIVPYIMAVTQLLTQLAQAVANFFGFKLADYDISSGIENISGGIGDISGGIGDIGDSADKTKKKVKGMLAPFDELNAIDFGDDSTGSGGTGGTGAGVGGGSLGIPPENYDWLQNEQLTKKVEEIKQKLIELLPWIEAIGLAFLTWKIGSAVINFFDKLGMITDKGGALKQLLGLTFFIAGITLLYNGLKKVIKGNITPEAILEIAAGTFLTIEGGAMMFKKKVPLKIAILATFVFTLATTILGWWKKYFPQAKQELYGNKQKLNFGEFVNVSFTAIGTGLGEAINNFFGKDVMGEIENWFRQHQVARTILGLFLGQWQDASVQETLFNGIKPIINTILLAIADWVEGIPVIGKAISSAIRTGVEDEGYKTENTIKYTTREALENANPWVQKESQKLGRDTIGAYNSELSTNDVSIKQTLEKTTGNGINNSRQEIENKMKELANRSNEALTTNVDGTNAGKKVVSTLRQGTENKTANTDLRKRLQTVASTSNSTLKNSINGNDAGKKLITSTETGLTDKKANNSLNRRATTVGTTIETTLEKKADAKGVGKNIVSGIDSGMKSNSGSKASIWSTVGNIASGIIGMFTKKLDIHSPSRVMRDYVGKFIPLGISEGIDNEAKSVYQSINSLSDEMIRISKEDMSTVLDINYDEVRGNIETQSTIISNISSNDFATKVGEYCYNAITNGFANNPQTNNVYIGNDKVYSGYGRYQNKQANKYGVATITQ